MQNKDYRRRVAPVLSLVAAGCVAADVGPAGGEERASLDAAAPALDDGCPGAGPGPRHLYHRDADGDGFGSARDATCAPGAGYVEARGDCDDRNSGVHPGAQDAPGGVDQDCGGSAGPDPHVGLSAGSSASIQAALDAAAPGATVWIGPGTYLERDLRFHGKAVRLASTHQAASTVIDAELGGSAFVLDAGETAGTILDGITVARGSAERAGGILVADGGATLVDSIVTGNVASARGGGGVLVERGRVIVQRCSLTDNRAHDDGSGGAILAVDAAVEVLGSALTGNNADTGAAVRLDRAILTASGSLLARNHAYNGGAIHATSSGVIMDGSTLDSNGSPYATGGAMRLESSRAQISRSTFTANRADHGAAMFADQSTVALTDVVVSGNRAGSDIEGDGAGLYLSRSTGAFTRCTFTGNRARTEYGNRGGALYLDRSSPTLTSCAILDNSVRGQGGGLLLVDSSPTLLNCVIARNEALGPPWDVPPDAAISAGAGIHMQGAASRPRIINTILAYNTGAGGHNLFNDPAAPGTPAISYSDLYNPPGQPNHNLAVLPRSLLTVEPGFLAYGEGGLPADLHLALGSPLVNAGLPLLRDRDGSPSDLGIYGGPLGASWDRDADGYRDYFWPGQLDDAPAGVNPSRYDADDADPAVH